MKVTIIVIGKTEDSYLEEGIAKYLDRIKHYLRIEWKTIPYIKKSGLEKAILKEKEGELILTNIKPGDFLILLDETGVCFSSTEMANFMSKTMINNASIVFVIGGAFGVSKSVRNRSNLILSMSKMTFSHQMVRLFLTEQLYRSMTILRGEKYHHE